MGNSDRKPGLIKRLWKWWRTPSRLALGTLLGTAFGMAASSVLNGAIHLRCSRLFTCS